MRLADLLETRKADVKSEMFLNEDQLFRRFAEVLNDISPKNSGSAAISAMGLLQPRAACKIFIPEHGPAILAYESTFKNIALLHALDERRISVWACEFATDRAQTLSKIEMANTEEGYEQALAEFKRCKDYISQDYSTRDY